MTQTNDVVANSMANLKRSWIRAPGIQEEDGNTDSFTLMNYNILADCHFKEDWYPYCPEGHRKMADRHGQLLVELKHHDADIICLQEVGPEYFAKILQPALYDMGYLGSFFSKTLGMQEGGATFYKCERFCKVEERGVLFNELVAKECAKAKLPDSITASVVDYTRKSQLLIVTKLLDRRAKSTVCIGNTHLLFDDYKNIDITALQAGLAINALVEFAGGPDQAHILCGDFNQEPVMVGYRLLEDGELDAEGRQFVKQYPIKTLDGQDKLKCLLDILPHCYRHPSRNLLSAYKSVMGEEVPFSNFEDYTGATWPPKSPEGHEIPFSNYDDYSGEEWPPKIPMVDLYCEVALDYQWYNSNSLTCMGVLEMIDKNLIKPFHACPNIVFPSDHLLVKAEYIFSGSNK